MEPLKLNAVHWRLFSSLGILICIFGTVFCAPVDEGSLEVRLKRSATNVTASPVTIAPTTESFLERYNLIPAIYIVPPIILGIPLFICFCCCLQSLPCCKSCSKDNEESDKQRLSNQIEAGTSSPPMAHDIRKTPSPAWS